MVEESKCIHYESRLIPSCCSRGHWAEICTLTGKERFCNSLRKWCKYEKKEEDDVHPTKLQDPDSG
jgi:hypothetical protein